MRIVTLSMMAALTFAPLTSADVFVTSDGTETYVGGLPSLVPNETYKGNSAPAITKKGYYVDGVKKKKQEHKKWDKIKSKSSFKLLPSLKKTTSKQKTLD